MYGLGGLVYIILGVVVASTHGYLGALTSLSSIISALLAIILWPAVLLGANLHLHLLGV